LGVFLAFPYAIKLTLIASLFPVEATHSPPILRPPHDVIFLLHTFSVPYRSHPPWACVIVMDPAYTPLLVHVLPLPSFCHRQCHSAPPPSDLSVEKVLAPPFYFFFIAPSDTGFFQFFLPDTGQFGRLIHFPTLT